MWYDDKFYEEPSEFEQTVEELKEELAKSVKGEILKELEMLREENQFLQEVKNNYNRMKSGFEAKVRELQEAAKNAELKAKKLRLKELMQDYEVVVWQARIEWLYRPKCEKCDSWRQVVISLPSGRTAKDICECGEPYDVAVPKKMTLATITERYGKIVGKYRGYEQGEGYDIEYHEGDSIIVEPGTDFDSLNSDGFNAFRTKEECLAYCQYLNKKNNVPSDAIYNHENEKYEFDS